MYWKAGKLSKIIGIKGKKKKGDNLKSLPLAKNGIILALKRIKAND